MEKKIGHNGNLSKFSILTVAVFAVGLNCLAIHTNAFVAGATDLTLPESYDDGRVPETGDMVILSNGTVEVTYATESWTKLNTLGGVIGLYPRGARLKITVPPGETADLAVPVFGSATYFSWRYGGITKAGGGNLRLVSNKRSGRDFFSPLDVEAGTLTIIPPVSDNNFYGALNVASGATCDIQKGASKTVLMHGLFGSGLVTNTGSSTVTFRFHNCADEPGDFSGCWGGAFDARSMDNGAQTLRGNGIAISTLYLTPSYLGVEFIGANSTPSSIGKGTPWLLGGTLEYLGSGETCTRTFYMSASDTANAISAGSHGNLIFNSSLLLPGNKPTYMQCMTLKGDNANEAVMGGSTPEDWSSSSGIRSLSFIKSGTGKWRFAESPNRRHAGSLRIQEGTLAFDSIEESGRISSLGTGTNRTDCYQGAYDETRGGKDYFISLGTEDDTKEAVLEFTGSKSQACTTRPIRLIGDGVFRNNGNALIRWAGIYPDGGDRTLILDGTSAKSNEVAEVSDGTGGGRLSVRKTGSGTWKMSGNLTFTGKLEVKGGKLVVSSPATNVYSWYRWTWRGFGGPSNTGSSNPSIAEIAFCDDTNTRHGTMLTLGESAADLKPGEIAPGSQYGYVLDTTYNGGLPGLCDMDSSNRGFTGNLYYPGTGAGKCSVVRSDPKTWWSVVMRLTNGTPEITTWDYMNTFAGTGGNSVTDTMLEGSVDGLHWELVDEHDYNIVTNKATSSFYWSFSGNAWQNGATLDTHQNGRSICGHSTTTYSTLTGVTSISVAAGATLEAEGDVVLSKLTVDCTSAGIVKGFRFAENGTLDVHNLPRRFGGDQLDCFEGIAGLENLRNWTLKVDETPVTRYNIRVEGGKVMICPRGTVISIR